MAERALAHALEHFVALLNLHGELDALHAPGWLAKWPQGAPSTGRLRWLNVNVDPVADPSLGCDSRRLRDGLQFGAKVGDMPTGQIDITG